MVQWLKLHKDTLPLKSLLKIKEFQLILELKCRPTALLKRRKRGRREGPVQKTLRIYQQKCIKTTPTKPKHWKTTATTTTATNCLKKFRQRLAFLFSISSFLEKKIYPIMWIFNTENRELSSYIAIKIS